MPESFVFYESYLRGIELQSEQVQAKLILVELQNVADKAEMLCVFGGNFRAGKAKLGKAIFICKHA